MLELQSDMARRKDDFVDFEQLGFNHLFLDEKVTLC